VQPNLAKLFSGLSPILDTSQNPFKKDFLLWKSAKFENFYCGRVQSFQTYIVDECKVSKLFSFGWANQARQSPSKSFELWYAPNN
jgi:hypothetical protein